MGNLRFLQDRRDETLLENLYRTAAEPELWRPVLTDVAERVSAGSSSLVLGCTGRLYGVKAIGKAADLLPEFLQTAPFLNDQHEQRALSPEGALTEVRDVLAPNEIETLPYCVDFFSTIERGPQLLAFVPITSGPFAAFIINRPSESAPFTSAERGWLEGLQPHLLRAVRINATSEHARMKSVVSMLSHLGVAAAFINAAGTVICENAAFADRRSDVFGSTGHLAGFGLSRAAARLREGLKAFERAWTTLFRVRPRISFPVKSADMKERFIIHLMLHNDDDEAMTPGILMLITQVGLGETLPIEMIEFLFGLTPAEAAVARDIGLGKSPAQIAAERRLSDHTVRDYLKRIYDKLDVHKQTDLMRLMQQPFAPFGAR